MTIALWQRPLARIVMGIVKAGNGAWFDPSDMSTLYQDAAGVTPVTAVEQPVGLMLDKSQGLRLGPELVTNGTFDSGAGWNLQQPTSGVSEIANGRAHIYSADGSLAYVSKSAISIINLFVKVVFDLEIVSGQMQLTDGVSTITYTTSGKKEATFKAGANVLQFKRVGAGSDFYIDNVSARELYGNHATQSITASRPVLSARKNVLLATETLATQSVTSIAAQYTLSFTGTGSVTLSGTATGTLTGTGTDRVSLTFTPTAGTLTLTVSGSVTKAQLELGTSAGPYQRVNTATDYDTDERYFPKYLRFDGIDDYMNLPYMGLYANGSASVVVARDMVTTTPVFGVAEGSTLSNNPFYIFDYRGSLSSGMWLRNDTGVEIINTLNANSNVVSNKTIVSYVDTSTSVTRFNNSQQADYLAYLRSGNLTLNTTTIGALTRPSVSGFTPLKLYGLIITKLALTDAQRIACERHLSRKAGVTL